MSAEKAHELLAEGTQALRRIILELESPDLTHTDVGPIVETYAAHLFGPKGIEFHVETDLSPRVDQRALTGLYRIIVEAVSNTARHAEPDHVSIKVTATGDTITGHIVDDGRGIPSDAPTGPKHLGIQSMQERTERLGGSLELQPRDENGGTAVRFQLPLNSLDSTVEQGRSGEQPSGKD